MPIRTYTLILTLAGPEQPPTPTAVAARLIGALDFASSRGGPFHTSRWANVWIDATEGDRTQARGDALFAGAKDLHERLREPA